MKKVCRGNPTLRSKVFFESILNIPIKKGVRDGQSTPNILQGQAVSKGMEAILRIEVANRIPGVVHNIHMAKRSSMCNSIPQSSRHNF